MKAISIRQPWAELIVSGRRRMEIRKWNAKHRGPFLIHSPLEVDEEACLRFKIPNAATGTIIGLSELITAKQLSEERWAFLRSLHLETGPRPYGDNTFGWFLGESRRFPEPILYRGRQGFFEVPDSRLPQKRYKVLKGGNIIESIIPGRFAGYRPDKIFGRLDCKSGMRMNKENRVFFMTWGDAIAEGYRPCKNCNPMPND